MSRSHECYDCHGRTEAYDDAYCATCISLKRNRGCADCTAPLDSESAYCSECFMRRTEEERLRESLCERRHQFIKHREWEKVRDKYRDVFRKAKFDDTALTDVPAEIIQFLGLHLTTYFGKV